MNESRKTLNLDTLSALEALALEVQHGRISQEQLNETIKNSSVTLKAAHINQRHCSTNALSKIKSLKLLKFLLKRIPMPIFRLAKYFKNILLHSKLAVKRFFIRSDSKIHLPKVSEAKDFIFSEKLISDFSTINSGSTIKILLAVPWLDRGGSSHHLSAVFQNLSDKNIHVTVIATHPDRNKDLWNGFDLYESFSTQIFDLNSIEGKLTQDAFFEELIKQLKPDIVLIVGSRYVYEKLGLIKTILPKCSVIDHLYNTEGHVSSNREFSQYIDFNIVANSDVKDKLIQLGEAESKIKVILHGIDTKKFYNKNNKSIHTLKNGSSTFGFIGRFSEEKRPEDFIKFLSHKPGTHGIMCGSGPLKVDVILKSIQLVLSSRLFFCTPEDCLDFYKAIDFLIVPSRIEGLPLVVLEAMALEIPCIAAQVGAIPTVISDGVNGYLYKSGNLNQLLEKVDLLSNLSLEELIQMKAKARKTIVDHFDVLTCTNSYYDTFITIASTLQNSSRQTLV